MKKIACTLLAISIFVVLASCNSANTNNSTDPNVNNNTACLNTPNIVEPEAFIPLPDSVERLGFSGGNIGAGGLVCSGDDGYIYYRSERDGWRLYRARPDGSDKAKVRDRIGHNINVLDGWVYFLDYHEGFPIYRIRTDGTEETKLVDGYCNNLYVADSGMYFDMRDESNFSHIYRADLDGSNMTLLFSGASLMYYYNGRIFLGAGQLGVYEIETGMERILADTYIANVSVDDSGIFFWAYDEGEFRRMDLEGGNESVILRGGDFFNYTDGYLYYMGISENANGPCHVINRLDLGTGETVTLYEALNELFDIGGNLIGVTLKQFNDGDFNSDVFEFNAQGEMVLKGGDGALSESVGYVYVAGEYVFMRANLREALLLNGSFDNIVRLDGGITIWD
jgi:hypothetical protein